MGGPLFVLVWCDWTMPGCVTGQQGTKAIIEIGAWVALGASSHHKPPDGRKRALTPAQSHCWSCFQTMAKWLNVNDLYVKRGLFLKAIYRWTLVFWLKFNVYVFLFHQLVIWGVDVGDLHPWGLPLPWHSCWGALQVAQRGTSHGQAWQLHQRAVRVLLYSPTSSQHWTPKYTLHSNAIPGSIRSMTVSTLLGPLHSCDWLLSVSSFTMSPLQSEDNGAALPRCHTERADGEQSGDRHSGSALHKHMMLFKKS